MSLRQWIPAFAMHLIAFSSSLAADEFQLRESLAGHEARTYSLAFSPDGKILAVGLVNGNIVLWDRETKKVRAVLKGHTFVAMRVRFSNDGKLLASAGGQDGTVRLWDVDNEKHLHTLFPPKIPNLKDSPSDVAFHPDCKTLAAVGFRGRLPVWNTASGKLVETLDGEEARCLAYSPDGKYLARSRHPQSIRIRELATGEENFVAGAGMVITLTLAFSPDSTLLAMAGNHRGDSPDQSQNLIRIWEVSTRKELAQLRGHRLNNIQQVVFSPNGKLLASSGDDRTIRVWDITGAKEISSRSAEETAHGLAFSPDGRTLAATAGKTVAFYAIPDMGKKR